MITRKLNELYGAVGAREDVDGQCPTVYIISDRTDGGGEVVSIEMQPFQARRLARQLNRWAKLIDPPKRRR